MSFEKNRGTGAGGAQTNKNGLSYESITDLGLEYEIISQTKFSKDILFKKNKNLKFTNTNQSQLFKSMDSYVDKNVIKAHGCKNPDECFINQEKKIMFIIEKKFQQSSGSVCEKIQTSDFKIWQYDRTFPEFKVVYIYCLSDWFKENCKAELEYLEYKNVPVFWGKSVNYKNEIIDYMINYIVNYV